MNDSLIIDLTEKYLIPIKFDAWFDSLGQKLFSEFNGYAIPLLIFLNGKGEELDRVVGYKDKDFLEILNNVLNNHDTFKSLSEKYYKIMIQMLMINYLLKVMNVKRHLSTELYLRKY